MVYNIVGYILLFSSANCSLCTAGTYQNQTGQDHCINCPAGYESASAMDHCNPCPEETYSTGDGQPCQPCVGKNLLHVLLQLLKKSTMLLIFPTLWKDGEPCLADVDKKPSTACFCLI